MKQNTGPRGGCTIAFLTISITLCMAIIGLALLFTQRVRGAELELPNLITEGRVDRSSSVIGFGTYSDKYLQKRWYRMCNGGARYDALREAFDLGKPRPCK